MDISFIILNYKHKGLLQNCLQSIINSDMKGLKYEIIVVDNASHDGVEQMLANNFSNLIFIASKKNRGFGAGNNLGIRQAQGKYVVILNPDTMALRDAFQSLFNFMETNPKVGIVGPQALNPDGTLQHTRCRYHDLITPIYRRTPLQKLAVIQKKLDFFLTKDKNYESTMPTDWLFGFCLCARKNVIEQVGLFDERFFLGFEDTDLCRKVWRAGHEVWYYPQAKLIHYPHRFSGEQNWFFGINKPTVRIHIVSWIKYFWKWRGQRTQSNI